CPYSRARSAVRKVDRESGDTSMTEDAPQPVPTEADKPSPEPRVRSERVARMADAQSRIIEKQGRAPEPKPAPPPPLAPEQIYDSGPRLRDLDAEIQKELDEALGGLSDKDIYGEASEENRKPAPASPQEG